MRSKISRIVNCFMGAITVTFVILVVNFLIMLFSSGEDGMRKTFFDTLYFESVTKSDGVVGMNFGFTEYYTPIIITVIALFIVFYIISGFYQG